jgi:hypothetical protein
MFLQFFQRRPSRLFTHRGLVSHELRPSIGARQKVQSWDSQNFRPSVQVFFRCETVNIRHMYRGNKRKPAPAPIGRWRSVDFSLRGRAQLAIGGGIACSAACAVANPITQWRDSFPAKAGQRSELTWQIFLLRRCPVATQLIISNRSACRLETDLSPALSTKLRVLIDTNVATYFPPAPHLLSSPPRGWSATNRIAC